MPWSAPLSRPIVLRDGTKLETLADAQAFVLALPWSDQTRAAWQTAAKLLIAAAERGGEIGDATAQVQIALYLQARGYDGKLIGRAQLWTTSNAAGRLS